MSLQQYQFWTDAVKGTSLGTSTAVTTLFAGANYSVPKSAGALIEYTPTLGINGAHTAAESMLIRSVTISPDIASITPKEFNFTGAIGGLGTFASVMYPTQIAYPFQTRLSYATNNITFQGQAQVANTVAPLMGFQLKFTDGGPLSAKEQFYTAPTSSTSSGTSAGQVTGGTITINNGMAINLFGGCFTPGVVTASEDLIGRYQVVSQNFTSVPSPQTMSAQTVGAGLGAAVAEMIPRDRREEVFWRIGNSFTGTAQLQLDKTLTAAGNFNVWVGYLKP